MGPWAERERKGGKGEERGCGDERRTRRGTESEDGCSRSAVLCARLVAKLPRAVRASAWRLKAQETVHPAGIPEGCGKVCPTGHTRAEKKKDAAAPLCSAATRLSPSVCSPSPPAGSHCVRAPAPARSPAFCSHAHICMRPNFLFAHRSKAREASSARSPGNSRALVTKKTPSATKENALAQT